MLGSSRRVAGVVRTVILVRAGRAFGDGRRSIGLGHGVVGGDGGCDGEAAGRRDDRHCVEEAQTGPAPRPTNVQGSEIGVSMVYRMCTI